SASAPDTRPSCLESVHRAFRIGEVDRIYCGPYSVAALADRRVERTSRKVQAPVLREGRHELLRRKAVLAVYCIQGVQFAIARKRIDDARPAVLHHGRCVQRIGTKRVGLASRSASS